MRNRFLIVFAVIAMIALMAVSVDSPKAVSKCPSDPKIIQEFDILEDYISRLAEKVLPKGRKISLLVKLVVAETAYRWGHPCVAANVIWAYLNETQAMRKGTMTGTAEALYVEGRRLLGNLLVSLPENQKCAGYERFTTDPAVALKESDNHHLVASVKFAAPRMVSVEAEDGSYTQLLASGAARGGEPGLPAVPMVQRLVAFPRGAEISIHTSSPTVAERIRLNLFPVQGPSPDQEDDAALFPDPFFEPPFAKDQQVYASREPFPPEVCTVTPLGQLRDVPIALVSCAAGSYDPKGQTYTSYDSVQWDLTFSGGSGAFMTGGAENPFEKDMMAYTDVLLNKDDVPRYVEERTFEPACHGEELIIVTHQLFRQAADKLAKWKNDKGIVTSVFEVNGSTTAGQIDAFVEQRYDECTVRPSYLLLLGDAEFVPTFYTWTVFSSQTATDFPYANYRTPSLGILDILPDFGVGRIPVDDLDQANIVIDKIIAYEGSPPQDSDFYKQVSLAAMFQCCRLDAPPSFGVFVNPTDGWDSKAYIETSELIRDELLDRGYNVERIYTEETCDKYWWNNLHKSNTPRFYYNGTPLPADIGENSGFVWNGSQQDVINAFNDGRFLIMQRDHGSENGWFRPNFNKNVINQLNNGNLLPVVFSVNCASGLFDHETNPGEQPPGERANQPYPCVSGPGQHYTCIASLDETYFAERLLREEGGGAVGVIAATRDSPDLGDDALTRGLFDAVWPGIDPKVGFGATSRHRLGDILNYAKLYTLSQCGIMQALEKPVYLLDVAAVFSLFHVVGDPTLEMWTSEPMVLSAEYQIETLTDYLRVQYPIDNVWLTAFQERDDGRVPIGRAKVKNGEATLNYVVPPDPVYPIMLSASMENAVNLLLTPRPEIEPVDLPDEGSFSDAAIRITFDDEERFLEELINDQYEGQGVRFLNDLNAKPIIVNDYLRDGLTHSEPYSVANNAETVEPGSRNVPLTMNFAPPVTRVGMYIGNEPLAGAVLRAYGAGGNLLFSVTRTGFGNDVEQFIGMDVGAPSIAKVELDYGDTLRSEEIDDLMFE